MDAFWCITLSILILRFWWKHQAFKKTVKSPAPIPTLSKESGEDREQRLQRERDIADLKRQGYTDEVIAIILPQLEH